MTIEGEEVPYLRSNYMLEAAKRALKEKGFHVSEEIKNVPGSSTIDLIGSSPTGKHHFIFDFKNAPVSTLDVSRFHASIKDLRILGRKSAFIFTDSSYTGSAEALSKKLKIQLIKTNEKTIKSTIKRIVK